MHSGEPELPISGVLQPQQEAASEKQVPSWIQRLAYIGNRSQKRKTKAKKDEKSILGWVGFSL